MLVRFDTEKMLENGDNVTGDKVICDTLKLSTEKHGNAMSDLDLQIKQMIEKSDGLYKFKVCGRTNHNMGTIWIHAETHIKGMSHACHICNKSFQNRPSLRTHINHIHNGQLTCDLCGKSGMNKSTYYHHKRTQHKILPGTL